MPPPQSPLHEERPPTSPVNALVPASSLPASSRASPQPPDRSPQHDSPPSSVVVFDSHMSMVHSSTRESDVDQIVVHKETHVRESTRKTQYAQR